jgi:TetR/AcrR family transcriptional regulator of autoinduction and epiphytic fitness
VLPTDGRAARAARTRAAIVDALLELLDEGDIQPTANRIAERAGISLRLIYHHFGDLEALFHAAAERQGERLALMAKPVPLDLPLDERIDAFVEHRTEILEWMTPVRRASLLQEPFSEELTNARIAMSKLAENQVAEVFRDELDALPAEERDVVFPAICMVMGWNAWDNLRTSGLSVDAARASIRRTVAALLA